MTNETEKLICKDCGEDHDETYPFCGKFYYPQAGDKTEKLKPAEWIERVLYAYGNVRYAEASASPSNESAREKLYGAIDTPVELEQQMRISDEKIAKILSDPDGWLFATVDFAKDLRDARAEIERLKKQINVLERTSK